MKVLVNVCLFLFLVISTAAAESGPPAPPNSEAMYARSAWMMIRGIFLPGPCPLEVEDLVVFISQDGGPWKSVKLAELASIDRALIPAADLRVDRISDAWVTELKSLNSSSRYYLLAGPVSIADSFDTFPVPNSAGYDWDSLPLVSKLYRYNNGSWQPYKRSDFFVAIGDPLTVIKVGSEEPGAGVDYYERHGGLKDGRSRAFTALNLGELPVMVYSRKSGSWERKYCSPISVARLDRYEDYLVHVTSELPKKPAVFAFSSDRQDLPTEFPVISEPLKASTDFLYGLYSPWLSDAPPLDVMAGAAIWVNESWVRCGVNVLGRFAARNTPRIARSDSAVFLQLRDVRLGDVYFALTKTGEVSLPTSLDGLSWNK